jgi:riboflavin kinase/FMN adenylyltransferase
MAERRRGESVVITFDPHPRSVLQPNDDSLRLLTTTEEKVAYCAEQGIDHLVVVPFDLEFSRQSAGDYIKHFLVRHFQPDRIVIGYDHRFGNQREGDISFLRYHGQQHGYEVVEIAAQEVNQITVSSTKVRTALREGRVREANELLGRPYSLTGTVVRGRQLGREIGFPTANLEVDHPLKQLPADGIYAVMARVAGQQRDGMLYIGDRPSLADGRGTTVELNLFDFAGDLYGESITVYFFRYIREDRALDGMSALSRQLEEDERQCRESLQEERNRRKRCTPDCPDTAVVILNYNGRDFLGRYLPAVIDSSPENCEVIVADNASTDDSVEWMRQTHPSIRCIQLLENHGFAAGYNEALQLVDAEIYVLLNSDVRVTPDWLTTILPLFQDSSVGAVQPKILSEHDPDRFEYAGASGGYLDFLGYPFCRGRIFGHTERDEGQYDDCREIFWATGAAFFVRSSVFHDLNGFEPEYFAHAEEIDLCWRMKRAGYRVLVEPAAAVYHVGGGTLAYDSPRKAYLNFRNTLITGFKNEHNTRLIWWLPVRLLLDGAAALLFLFQGKFGHILAIVRAHFHFYQQLPMWVYRRERRNSEIRDCRVGSSRTDYGRVADSIALHYYLLGHHRFNEVAIPQVRVEPETVTGN